MEKCKYFKQQNNDLEVWLSVALLPLIFCTAIHYEFVSIFGGYVLFGVYIVSFASLMIFNSRLKTIKFDIKAFVAFLCFFFVYLFMIFISDSSESLFAVAFFSIAVCYAFGVVYNSTNEKMLKYISILSLVCISISVVLSVLVLVENPGASRVLASSSFEIYGASEYRNQGLAGFGLTYGMVFFVPFLFYWAKKTTVKKHKTLMFVLAITTIMNITLSGYTTAFLLLILEAFLYLFINMKPYLKLFLCLFLIVFVFFQSYFLPDFLYSISDLFDSKQMADHIVELADILAGKSLVSDLDRTELMKASWDAFLTNPLFGGYVSSNNINLGGHSTFFDVLGSTGLLGCVPYCLFLWLFHKQVKQQIKNSATQKLWLLETIVFVVLQILNPIMANYEIVYAYMCVVPATLFYIDMLGEKQIEGSAN